MVLLLYLIDETSFVFYNTIILHHRDSLRTISQQCAGQSRLTVKIQLSRRELNSYYWDKTCTSLDTANTIELPHNSVHWRNNCLDWGWCFHKVLAKVVIICGVWSNERKWMHQLNTTTTKERTVLEWKNIVLSHYMHNTGIELCYNKWLFRY